MYASASVKCAISAPQDNGLSPAWCHSRDRARYAPSQWETSLHCNDVSHWLAAHLDRSMHCISKPLLFTEPLGTHFSEILVKNVTSVIQQNETWKCRLQSGAILCRPQCCKVVTASHDIMFTRYNVMDRQCVPIHVWITRWMWLLLVLRNAQQRV